MKNKYIALVSSDWNECLSPSRPFDPVVYKYPNLKDKIHQIFRAYTSNKITYSTAITTIKKLIPKPISQKDMENYLKENFSLYKGVEEFLTWCCHNNILFMINTTGWMGYFQQAIKFKLLNNIKIISASPAIKFENSVNNDVLFMELLEIEDKGKNTEIVAKQFDIKHIFIIGDSGGDGPHFVWGKKNNAMLIGCMTKPSLINYCHKNNIKIDLFVGEPNRADEGIDYNRLITYIKNNIN